MSPLLPPDVGVLGEPRTPSHQLPGPESLQDQVQLPSPNHLTGSKQHKVPLAASQEPRGCSGSPAAGSLSSLQDTAQERASQPAAQLCTMAINKIPGLLPAALRGTWRERGRAQLERELVARGARWGTTGRGAQNHAGTAASPWHHWGPRNTGRRHKRGAGARAQGQGLLRARTGERNMKRDPALVCSFLPIRNSILSSLEDTMMPGASQSAS